MPRDPKLSILDYYDLTPGADNLAGDIWSDLPVHGLLGNLPLPGLVITPACDLSNRKVETISYLPIIPVRTFFSTLGFLPDVQREIERQLGQADLDRLVEFTSRFVPPERDTLAFAEAESTRIMADTRAGAKRRAAAERILAGFQLIDYIRQPIRKEVPSNLLVTLFGEKAFKSILDRIVTNAYKLDLHFLPSDDQPEDWSGVPTHSVVLFRYVMSAPIEIFDCAQDIQQPDWESIISKLEGWLPGVRAFTAQRPMKRSRLKPRFLSDLLTRYVSMFARLGSPDFTPETVQDYVQQLGEK